MSSCSVVYVAFDRFPAPKGAATHIAAFVSGLAQVFTRIDLVTVAGPADVTGRNSDGSSGAAQPLLSHNISHTEIPALGNSLAERVLHFRKHLRNWWGDRKPRVAHVRSIFEGYPIAREKDRWCDKLVFEVNGLPSVELKYHYPQVADDRELIRKLLFQEQCCLEAADLVLTVSDVSADYLRRRGVPPERLCVIPNGVDTDCFAYRPPRAWEDREIRMLYSGTFSAWQGVQTAIEALALYRRDAPARLSIVGSARTGQARGLREWAFHLGVLEQVELLDPVSQHELAALHHQADVVLAPLLANDRNLVQGCCPLKVLEAMSCGAPLVSSDLPVVSALARPSLDALLVRPGSAKAIKDALLLLKQEPDLAAILSRNARARVERECTWNTAQQRLLEAYRNLLS